MALVVTDPDTGQSYAIYVDPRTGESASVPISSAQAAAATPSTTVDESGYYTAPTIDFNPITQTVGAPASVSIPKEVASNSTFNSINSATGGQLAELYGDIKAGNVSSFTGQYNEPTLYLGSTGRQITMTPTSTPGEYLAGLNTGGGGYTVPVKVDSKGNVSIADTAVTNANNINYVSNPSRGLLSDFAENLQMAAPYLAAGYFATQVLPGLLSGAGGASAAALDAEFLAADAVQLANQGLSEAAIAQNLAQYGSTAASGLAASMAANGLSQAQITNSLTSLSANTGLTLQNYTDADMIAQDALNLQQVVGNNFPAIEQNLIASGVDPLVAADVSQQIAFNPALTTEQLSSSLSQNFGNNIYGASTLAPTAVLQGSGGLLSDLGAAEVATGAATGAVESAAGGAAGLGAQGALTGATLAKLVGGLLAGGALTGGMGGGGNVTLPTPSNRAGVSTGSADYSPEYYQQLQQYYNAYMPTQPKDVATPLQQWYETKFTPDANVTNKLFGV